VLRNAAVLDPAAGSLAEGQAVVVEDGTVVEVGATAAVRAGDANAVDVAGRTVMPGLIDAHVHVNAATADLGALEEWSPAYVTARAAGILRGMLDRGFTTVRDVAGADYGIAAAVSEGLLPGPRVVFGGKALSQTGGHGDSRGPGRAVLDQHPCCPTLTVVADGVAEVRRAAREQLRRGAHHVKVMLSGGVASPTDRIDSTQYSMEELRAVVEEARAANRYVTGHAYAAAAVNRGLEAGVACIEHGNLMDGSSVELFRRTGACTCPPWPPTPPWLRRGWSTGCPPTSTPRCSRCSTRAWAPWSWPTGPGCPSSTGPTCSAGCTGASSPSSPSAPRSSRPPTCSARRPRWPPACCGLEGRVGVVAPGASADLLVVDGNPLERLEVLTDPVRHLRLVMQSGRVHRNDLG
jgi:imidazolonepropionase-like amidohydrolase